MTAMAILCGHAHVFLFIYCADFLAFPHGFHQSFCFVLFIFPHAFLFFPNITTQLLTPSIKHILARSFWFVFLKDTNVSVIRVNQMPSVLHSSVEPGTIVPWTCLFVGVYSLAMATALIPLPFVSVPIGIGVGTPPLARVVYPGSLIFGAVGIQKDAFAIFLAV